MRIGQCFRVESLFKLGGIKLEVTDEEVLASMNPSPATMPLKIRKRLTLPAKLTERNGGKSRVEVNGISPVKTNLDSRNDDVLSPSPTSFGRILNSNNSRTPSKTNGDGLYDLKTTASDDRQSPKIVTNDHGDHLNVPSLNSSSARSLVKSPGIPGRFLSRTPPIAESNSQASPKMTRTKSGGTTGDTKVRSQVKPISVPLTKPLKTSPKQDNIGESNQESNNGSRQSNVLNAVLALIDELGEKELQTVQRKLQLAMLNRQGQPGNK
ncbi:14279_t:CDS:2 [Acaulospora colombiana]|uniref:14279_t:CDS:1 n=1 Tax=Acaulospora colombiana TaxID=27376 RepID=A0ACA9M9N2_9GLOM|nr:14279_t:CDS:2 [Acaulospora colombiana]